MRILAYIHVRRALGETTGVARHAIRMIRGLVDRHGASIELLGARDELAVQQRHHPDWALADLPAHGHRLPRAIMERWWFAFGRPAADSYWPGCQWVYVPNEAFVPVRRARLAATVHDLDCLEPDLPWYHEPPVARARRSWSVKLPRMLARSDVVLAVSQFTRTRVIELLGVDPGRVAVVGNGVDTRFFLDERASAAPLPDEPPYLLQVGAMIDKKGAPAVLALARRLLDRRSPIQIWISGRIEAKHAPAVAALPNVRALGFVPDDQLPLLMRRSVALILLSRYEGFGMPPLEAMATGAPAIVSHHASLPEVAGEAGIVVDPNDPDQVADAAERLLTDTSWRRAVIARGREHAKRFTWDACVDRLATALRDAR